MEHRGVRKPAMYFGLALATILSVPLVLGFLNAWHPAFDSLSHFRAHLAVLLGMAALPLLISAFWKEGAVSLVLAIASLWTVFGSLPLTGLTPVRAASPPADGGRAVYRLLHLNVRYDNAHPEKVLSLIGGIQPDTITLNEVSERWIDVLDRLSAVYPHRVVCRIDDPTGGVAILSRRPFENGPGHCYDGGSLAIASVNFDGQEVKVAALHLTWPWPYSQPEQIDDVTPMLATLTGAAILTGDFNATGWSVAASRVARAGDLTPVGSIGPTWLHRSLPKALRPWIGLPIDHVFAKGNVAVRSAKAQEDAGSDHLPVLVEFSLLPGAPSSDEEQQTTATGLSTQRLPKENTDIIAR
jgi:endonuclease/exonuclease/phosphatase (EEP) superfamily protein YafD